MALTDARYEFTFNYDDPTISSKYSYPSNYIKTSKYTLLTFLPLNLYSQVRIVRASLIILVQTIL